MFVIFDVEAYAFDSLSVVFTYFSIAPFLSTFFVIAMQIHRIVRHPLHCELIS